MCLKHLILCWIQDGARVWQYFEFICILGPKNFLAKKSRPKNICSDNSQHIHIVRKVNTSRPFLGRLSSPSRNLFDTFKTTLDRIRPWMKDNLKIGWKTILDWGWPQMKDNCTFLGLGCEFHFARRSKREHVIVNWNLLLKLSYNWKT